MVVSVVCTVPFFYDGPLVLGQGLGGLGFPFHTHGAAYAHRRHSLTAGASFPQRIRLAGMLAHVATPVLVQQQQQQQ